MGSVELSGSASGARSNGIRSARSVTILEPPAVAFASGCGRVVAVWATAIQHGRWRGAQVGRAWSGNRSGAAPERETPDEKRSPPARAVHAHASSPQRATRRTGEQRTLRSRGSGWVPPAVVQWPCPRTALQMSVPNETQARTHRAGSPSRRMQRSTNPSV